jgi:hypothetical protein
MIRVVNRTEERIEFEVGAAPSFDSSSNQPQFF